MVENCRVICHLKSLPVKIYQREVSWLDWKKPKLS